MFILALGILGLVLVSQALKYHGRDVEILFIRVNSNSLVAVGALILAFLLILVLLDYFVMSNQLLGLPLAFLNSKSMMLLACASSDATVHCNGLL
jgi:hypothetical protein